MVAPADFRQALRRGRHGGTKHLVVHYATDQTGPTAPLVGFAVPKRELAHATDRHRVQRQLRHLVADYVDALPASARLVISVKATALGCTSECLRRSLVTGLRKVGALEADAT